MKHNISNESGFSYIDVMVAITILMIGILGATAALTTSVIRSFETKQQALAKQIAHDALESVFVARDMKRPGALEGWEQIGMEGTNPRPVTGEFLGKFMVGFRPVRADIGFDGIAGSRDDACDEPTACANADGTTNTSEIYKGFERKIEITDMTVPNRPVAVHGVLRRRVVVTVRYFVNQAIREEKVSTIITRFA